MHELVPPIHWIRAHASLKQPQCSEQTSCYWHPAVMPVSVLMDWIAKFIIWLTHSMAMFLQENMLLLDLAVSCALPAHINAVHDFDALVSRGLSGVFSSIFI